MNSDDRPLRWWEETHGVPRRFGVGTLLAVTVVYALAFSLASATSKRVGDPLMLPAVVSILFVWLTLVALSQALLFGGRRPRRASLLTGAALMECCVVVLIARWLYRGFASRGDLALGGILLAGAPVVGALLGYLTGGVVAGVFVILAGLKRR